MRYIVSRDITKIIKYSLKHQDIMYCLKHKACLLMCLMIRMAWLETQAICNNLLHYSDDIMGAMVSQIISLTIVYSIIYSGADQRKHQSSVSLAFVRGIHRGPMNSPHKGPVTRKMFPFDGVIKRSFDSLALTQMLCYIFCNSAINILRPEENGLHFADHVFKWIFLQKILYFNSNFT